MIRNPVEPSTRRGVAPQRKGIVPWRHRKYTKKEWVRQMVEQGFERAEALAAYAEGVRRGIDPTRSDDLFDLDIYLDELETGEPAERGNPRGRTRGNPRVKLSPYAKMQRAALRRAGVKPAPSPKFKIGQYVEDIEAHNGNTRPGRVMFTGSYDDLIGGYRYKVQTQDGHVLYRDEPSLRRIRKPAWAGRASRKNPKAARAHGAKTPTLLPLAQWGTYSGGLSSPDRYGYAHHAPNGRKYNIEPYSTHQGRHAGYILTVTPADRGLHGWITEDGKENGNGVSSFRSAQAALKAARLHAAARSGGDRSKQNPGAAPRASYVVVYQRSDGQEVVEGWSLKKKGRPTAQALSRYVAEMRRAGEDIVTARIVRRDLPSDGMSWGQAMTHGTTVAMWPGSMAGGRKQNPTPAIRAFKKAMGHGLSTRDLASEAIGAYGWKTGLPGFPRWLGDPVPAHNQWNATKMRQLADWIDEHGGLRAHPYRDALRIEAGTLRQNPWTVEARYRRPGSRASAGIIDPGYGTQADAETALADVLERKRKQGYDIEKQKVYFSKHGSSRGNPAGFRPRTRPGFYKRGKDIVRVVEVFPEGTKSKDQLRPSDWWLYYIGTLTEVDKEGPGSSTQAVGAEMQVYKFTSGNWKRIDESKLSPAWRAFFARNT